MWNNFSKTSCVICELSEILYFILKLVYKALILGSLDILIYMSLFLEQQPTFQNFPLIITSQHYVYHFHVLWHYRLVNKNITKWRIHQKWHFKWLLGEIYALINNGFSRNIVKMYSKKQIITWLCKSAQCKLQCISYIHVYYYPAI